MDVLNFPRRDPWPAGHRCSSGAPDRLCACVFSFSYDPVVFLCHKFIAVAIARSLADTAIPAVRLAMTTLCKGDNVLTSVHAEYLRLCLLSRHYRTCEALIDTYVCCGTLAPLRRVHASLHVCGCV